jgi:hypothetical protein
MDRGSARSIGLTSGVFLVHVVFPFTLHTFLERTLPLRANLPLEHKLFLAYIEDTHKTCFAKEATVANWVKDIMKQAGIDTEKYGPHSIRSTASTKAVEKGHLIENVKQYANWSRNTQTFERFYFSLCGEPYHIGSN